MLEAISALRTHAQERPHDIALRQVAPACAAIQTRTWMHLWQDVNSFAAQMKREFQPGATVILCLPNRPEFVISFLAALLADMTVFPVHPALSPMELQTAARRSLATAFIGSLEMCRSLDGHCTRRMTADDLESNALNEPIAFDGRHGAMLLQSSGTTGQPKIVHRRAHALDAVTRNVVHSVRMGDRDHVLAAVPLCHSYGVESALLSPILSGASIHLADGFDPAAVCAAVESGGITVLPGVPFMFETVAERCTTAPNLRMAYSAGAPLPASVWEAMRQRLGVRVGQLYGSTEVGAVTFNDPSADVGFDFASVGSAMPGVEIRILHAEHANVSRPMPIGQEGQVAIAAPSVLDRYVDDDASPLVGGFFLTGDLGRMDSRGRLTITGRLKLQIDIGGLKVNPLEIEQVLLSHDAVRECAVVPMAVSQTLNRLKSVIALKAHRTNADVEEIREFLRTRLAPYKIPRIIEVRDALPKSPTGKINREALRCD